MPDRSKRCEQLNDQFPGKREWHRASLFWMVPTEEVFSSVEGNELDH